MDPNTKMPRDVHELLLSADEEEGKARDDDQVEDARQPRGPFFTTPVIVTCVVAALTAIGLIIIYSSPILSEQFSAMLSGELGKYKEQLRKVREDKIRDIENLTSNKYGSLALFYSPRDSKVTISESKYKLDCAKTADEDAQLACLRDRIDYAQAPERREIDNPSLHLDRAKKEVVEQIPLNDIPIQEASEDRKQIFRYEYTIKIDADGYYPRTFFITGDKERPQVRDVELLFWEQKGPGVFMADFRGADLMPKPETAKENYKKARFDMACIDKEVDAKRKAGKNISEDTVQGLYLELINRHGFKTFDEWSRIESALRADAAFATQLEKEINAHQATCR
ncbi:MAG: hypothetical protein FJ087_05020 [Deltaproteobacteria bacterium]|nr:hypothetical protein [Deltaproteobacteria bacterium]